MRFEIFINGEEISSLENSCGKVIMIPFTGRVESALFTGKILPGACDVQIEDVAKIRRLCARYMFSGQDGEGNPCKLFVENTGFVAPSNVNESFIRACPRFLSDSPALSSYLSVPHFRSEIQGTEKGVEIRIFDTEKEI